MTGELTDYSFTIEESEELRDIATKVVAEAYIGPNFKDQSPDRQFQVQCAIEEIEIKRGHIYPLNPNITEENLPQLLLLINETIGGQNYFIGRYEDTRDFSVYPANRKPVRLPDNSLLSVDSQNRPLPEILREYVLRVNQYRGYPLPLEQFASQKQSEHYTVKHYNGVLFLQKYYENSYESQSLHCPTIVYSRKHNFIALASLRRMDGLSHLNVNQINLKEYARGIKNLENAVKHLRGRSTWNDVYHKNKPGKGSSILRPSGNHREAPNWVKDN